MMTKGMKSASKTKEKAEDKDTNINCSKCGETVGVVAAGYSLVIGNQEGSIRQTSICKCGARMIFSVVRG